MNIQHTKKRTLAKMPLLLLCVLLALSLSGCRRRIVEQPGESDVYGSVQSGHTASERAGERVNDSLPPQVRIQAQIDPVAAEEIGEADASRAPGAHVQTRQAQANSVTISQLSSVGGETRPMDEGGTVGTIMDEYTQLLDQGLGTLYECQMSYVYLELAQDYLSVNRHSDMHQLILDSGGYNVAEKRGDDKLIVDDAWVIRKNPTVIVKFVDASVLGAGISDTAAAQAVRASIAARPGWQGVNAVLHQNVLLLSASLLSTPEGRFVAKLYMSTSMYPTLFSHIDADEVCAQLMRAAGHAQGRFAFAG